MIKTIGNFIWSIIIKLHDCKNFYVRISITESFNIDTKIRKIICIDYRCSICDKKYTKNINKEINNKFNYF